MKWRWLALSLFLLALQAEAQERRVYEGVVEVEKKTIGTVILLEITANSVSGWIRLDEFVPIEGVSATKDTAEFRAAGNQYLIEERKGKITYSGPDGAASRYITRLERLTGPLQELLEETRATGAAVAVMEVRGRRRELRYGRPALWKQNAAPFENFSRLEELLGKEISVWVADANERSGRMVVVEEPSGMDIPLKAPKKPKNEKKQEKSLQTRGQLKLPIGRGYQGKPTAKHKLPWLLFWSPVRLARGLLWGKIHELGAKYPKKQGCGPHPAYANRTGKPLLEPVSGILAKAEVAKSKAPSGAEAPVFFGFLRHG